MSWFTDEEMGVRKCRVCGCDDYQACYDPRLGGGCAWVEDDLCSVCGTEEQFQEWWNELQRISAEMKAEGERVRREDGKRWRALVDSGAL